MEKTNESKRTLYGNVASAVGIAVNMLLAVMKIAVGVIFGAVSVLADGLNNLTDCGSSVVSLVSFKLSAKPADKEHPYGHERIEYVMSLIVAFAIFAVAFETLKESVGKIIEPVALEFSFWILIVLIASILVKTALYFFYKGVGKKIDSSILKAAAVDCLTDCISTTVVLAAIIISRLAGINVDGYSGIFVSLFIAYSAVGILREVFSMLIGKAPDEQMICDIKNKILSYQGVLGVHDLSVYSYGPNKYFASVHVEVDAGVDVLESHELVDLIEKDFAQDTCIILTGHLDPIVTDDERVTSLRAKVEEILKDIDASLSLHDFRMVFGENRTNVLFDISVPFGFHIKPCRIKELLEEKVAEIDKKYCLVITVDHCC